MRRLLEIVRDAKPTVAGKHADHALISQVAVVAITASWETFIEDLALEVMADLVRRSEHLPGEDARSAVLRVLRLVPELTPETTYAYTLLPFRDRLLGRFDTPKQPNIDSLFRQALNLDALSAAWHWPRVSRQRLVASLNAFVTLRGDIAHRARAPRRISRASVLNFIRLVERLSVLTTNHLGAWYLVEVGSPRWGPIPLSAVA